MDYKTLFSQTKDLSVLLVEDYEPLRNDMSEMFDDLFKCVVVASDGSEALSLYQEHYTTQGKNFDLLVTDIQMPVMNGVELSESVRDIHEDQEIIVLSAHTDSDYLLRLINLGIAQFITKPIKHEELLDALSHVSKKINTVDVESQDTLLMDLGENYIWDKENLLLTQDKNRIDLTRHELFLMQLFADKEGKVCSNDDIMQDFYGHGIDIAEKSIRNLVFKLRKKLPIKSISSIYGMGYKLTSIA